MSQNCTLACPHRQAESWRPDMDPMEYRYTRLCSIEDHYDQYTSIGSADGDSNGPGGRGSGANTRCCIPDLLWWARPWLGDYVDPDHGVDGDVVDDDVAYGGDGAD